MGVLDDLERLFGDYQSPRTEPSWRQAKLDHPVGSVLRGQVAARFPFGVFLDAGIGFPILLEIIKMSNLTPERYRTLYLESKCCVIGEEMVGRITGFDDEGHQIGLTQHDPDAWLDGAAPGGSAANKA